MGKNTNYMDNKDLDKSNEAESSLELDTHKFLGIDTGTTTIVASEWKSKGAQILREEEGHKNWPAVFDLVTWKSGREAMLEERSSKQEP